MLDAKADVDAKERLNWTPLHIAARCGSLEIAKILIYYGATIDIKNNDGETPLEVAGKDIYVELKKFIDFLIETKKINQRSISCQGAIV